jgi:succinyl-CoA synthetase beta subunit
MKIHEYCGEGDTGALWRHAPRAAKWPSPKEAREAAQRLKTHITVVKAQIHAGGRGKAAASSWRVPPTRPVTSPAKSSA